MDAMALLCNLHADGPTTQKLLRRAGCDSLQALEAIPPERLAAVLDCSPSYARRFLQEARNLSARTGSSLLEEELEQEEEEARTRAAQAPASAGVQSPPPRSLPASISKPIPVQPAGERLRPALLEGLDETWCDRLASRGVATLKALVDAPTLRLSRELELSFPRLLDLQCLAQRLVSAQPARSATPGGEAQGGEATAGERLRPGLLEGLDESWCRRLEASGVRTLEALADAATRELSREQGLPYPRLLELQCQARGQLSTLIPAVPRRSQPAPSRPERELQPALTPSRGRGPERSDPGPGGPFV